MENFTNESVEIKDLPNFKQATLYPVEKRYKTVLLLNFAIPMLVYLVGIFVALEFIPIRRLFIGLGAIALGIPLFISFTEIIFGFPKRKFGVREKDIIYQKGFWIFKETVVPFSRIQHVEIRQNLMARLFKLYSLKLYTAGNAMGDLVISGLNEEIADKLKAKVLKAQDKQKQDSPSTETSELTSNE